MCWAQLTDDGMELLRRVAPSHVAAVRRNLVDAVDKNDFEAFGRVFTAVLQVEGEAHSTSLERDHGHHDCAVLRLDQAACRIARAGLADVLDASDLARALYSSDASLYRVVPAAIARPRTVDELGEVLDVARSAGVPVTTRGAGTLCRQRRRSGLVVDTARHLNKIIHIDPESRTAEVEPGVVQASLQTAAGSTACGSGPIPRRTRVAPSAA